MIIHSILLDGIIELRELNVGYALNNQSLTINKLESIIKSLGLTAEVIKFDTSIPGNLTRNTFFYQVEISFRATNNESLTLTRIENLLNRNSMAFVGNIQINSRLV